jgi:hypothetical protein
VSKTERAPQGSNKGKKSKSKAGTSKNTPQITSNSKSISKEQELNNRSPRKRVPSHSCSRCYKIFQSRGEHKKYRETVLKHYLNDHSVQIFLCDWCNEAFMQVEELFQHHTKCQKKIESKE